MGPIVLPPSHSIDKNVVQVVVVSNVNWMSDINQEIIARL